ncbi:MAG: MmcQ/YjbR family DNA-binding protein [Actinomycetota bacterium]|nr:MmcQ/YjbR family DNA-binding protein [Actinomycetota bacterium]
MRDVRPWRVLSHEDVRGIALGLPGSYEQASYGGRPSWRTKARVFTWIRDDPEALVVWVASVEDKDALVASEPDKFFTTPHYDGHPIVLVRLEAVDDQEATELLTESWRLRASRSLIREWDAARR